MTAVKDVGFFVRAGVSSLDPAVGQCVLFDTEIQKLRVYTNAGWVTLNLGVSDIIALMVYADFGRNCYTSGLLGTPPVNSLTLTSPAGVAYLQGLRFQIAADTYTYPVNSDTYCFLQNNGTIIHSAVPNSDPPPNTGGIVYQQVVTDATKITGVNVVVPPFGQWHVAYAQDGESAVPIYQLQDINATRWQAIGDNFIQYGIGSPVPGSGRTTSTVDGRAWINGYDFFVPAQPFTYPANKDTWDFIESTDGVVTHYSVNHGADMPAVDGVAIQKVVTDATDITAIEYQNTGLPHIRCHVAENSDEAVPLAQAVQICYNSFQSKTIDFGGKDLTSSTTYKFFVPFDRAGHLWKAGIIAESVPSAGSTLQIKNGTSSGAQCLDGGAFDVTTLAANTFQELDLSSNPSDLESDEATGFYVIYTTGASYPTGPVAIRLEHSAA